MKASDIINLINAGYSKEQIEKMEAELEKEPEKKEPEKKEPEKKEPEKKEPEKKEPEKKEPEEDPEITKLKKQIEDLQKENAKSARQPEKDDPLTAEKIIESFIKDM